MCLYCLFVRHCRTVFLFYGFILTGLLEYLNHLEQSSISSTNTFCELCAKWIFMLDSKWTRIYITRFTKSVRESPPHTYKKTSPKRLAFGRGLSCVGLHLLCVIAYACFSNHVHFDLTRIIEFIFDLLANFSCSQDHLIF